MEGNLEPITEEEVKHDMDELNMELHNLKHEISKRDEQIAQLQQQFENETERSRKLMELVKSEETRNFQSEDTISELRHRLDESEKLVRELREVLDSRFPVGETSSQEEYSELSTRISDGEEARKEMKEEIIALVQRCKEMEEKLENERSRLEEEQTEHAKVLNKLAQSEELLKTFKDDTFFASDDDTDEDENTAKYKKVIASLKAGIDVQSKRNMELHEEIQRLKHSTEDQASLIENMKSKAAKDQKLIKELNFQNEREYKKNEKMKGDTQRMKKELDSWKRIQADMKMQYQDLRVLYDGVCKHTEEQKREIVEMKLLMERDKRSIARQRDEIEKYKGRAASLRQTYDDLKIKFDENAKTLEEKTNEASALANQAASNKKLISDLQNINKDLKKRSDFSQKELIEKHKLLMQAEEKMRGFQEDLDEKDKIVKDSARVAREAEEKASKSSQEASTKERDLHDRIELIKSLESQVQLLTDVNKKTEEDNANLRYLLKEKENIIHGKQFEVDYKQSSAREAEERNAELGRHVCEVEQLLEDARKEIEEKQQTIDNLEHDIETLCEKVNEREAILNEDKTEVLCETPENTPEDISGMEETDMEKKVGEMKILLSERDKELKALISEMEEDKNVIHFQTQLLKDVESRVEEEDTRLEEIEERLKNKCVESETFRAALAEKDAEMEEMKVEFRKGVEMYLAEVDELNNALGEARSENERLQQETMDWTLSRSDEILKVQEEKKELELQLTNELKREKQTSQSMIKDLREDIRALTANLKNEREIYRFKENELDSKERQFKTEKESLLEHIEELQSLVKQKKEDNNVLEERLMNQDKEMQQIERRHVSELQAVEERQRILQVENDNLNKLDQQDKFDELRAQLENKKTQLCEAESRLDEAEKIHNDSRKEVLRLLDEKDEYISHLKRENSELKRTLEIENEWMDENATETLGKKLNDKKIDEEARMLSVQKKVVQKLKTDIEDELELAKIDEDEEGYGVEEERRYEPSKEHDLKTAVTKALIILLLTPLAYLFSTAGEVCLTLGAVLVPVIYFIYRKPWCSHEKDLYAALNKLTTRLAAECAETEFLKKAIENMTQGQKELGLNNNASDTPPTHVNHKSPRGKISAHCKDCGKQGDPVIESDNRKLQRQQSLLEKLNIILYEKNARSHLGRFWGYEELKMALNRLRHEREIEQGKQGEQKDIHLHERLSEVVEEAVRDEKRRKFKALVLTIVTSLTVMLLFSLRSSSLFAVVTSVVVTVCSFLYGIRSWRKIENLKSKLSVEKCRIEEQTKEISELLSLLDREHEVVCKQKIAIEALERGFNEEFRKNKDHQLTIAKLTLVFQEEKELQEVLRQKEDFKEATSDEAQKQIEDHTRSKYLVFRNMQRELEEQQSHSEEQRRVIDELKTATSIITNAAASQLSELRSQREVKLTGDSSVLQGLKYLSGASLSTLSVAMFYTGYPWLAILPLAGIALYSVNKRGIKISKASFAKYGSKVTWACALLVLICGLFVASSSLPSVSPSAREFVCLSVVPSVVIVALAYLRHKRRTISNDTDDLWNRIHERTQLIDVQSEEIQTLKKLLEVERTYSQYTEQLLKEKNGGVEGLDGRDSHEIANKKAMEDDEKCHQYDLTRYELDEVKIFLSEEKRTNIELRKSLAEAQESKSSLTCKVRNLERMLEVQRLSAQEKCHQGENLLKDRIQELVEDLEGERKTKQELSAQLIEERSLRELKQIELADLGEKLRDEQQITMSLKEQLKAVNRTEVLKLQLTSAQRELDDERLANQSQNQSFLEALHRLRENNLVLQRGIRELNKGGQDSSCDGLGDIREQSEVQQEEIEGLQTQLEEIINVGHAQKYQDVIEELQTLRRKLEFYENQGNNEEKDGAKIKMLAELEHEREKNKILDEAVEELQRQQREQRLMYEKEKMRSIQLARQVSGEDIPQILIEEEAKEDVEDTRGVLYWLGTNGGLTEWKNPGEAGLVTITRSSYGHGKATDAADRRPSWCSTSNKPNQWWKIDFGDKRTVVANGYRLRHGWSGNAGALRHWVLEGSMDGRRWLLLKQHENDDSLNSAYASGYWKLENITTGYRFVRVRQTGPNSTGTNALRLCGFEVYGKIVIAE
ncbi:repetitive organellar protein [Nematostella vectensis]|uniref:repetitive organellar protein n=1 Tax=Nematostella vectensis TaxID=45351 RepID=UPI00138FD382|nr:repetitive organellar protein [Nematostella vectensis]XP_048581708.1 repetitive organellar protein [Nematostella vectensis]XP_048581709.1 repetitive organellar protein [Nematostella vectensis]